MGRDAPLNILTVNYRYFISGGPERYLFNISSLLEKNQHRVIPFSIQHQANAETPYSKYFLPPIAEGDGVYFNQLKLTPRSAMKLMGRSFYSNEARRKLGWLLSDERIDLAYLLHFMRWISPSILDELKQRAVPVVVRVSDYGYLCPQAHFLRAGRICELCLRGSVLNSLRYKCLQNSYTVSAVNLFSVYLHRIMRVMDRIDAFVCPSKFLLSKMREGGIVKDKLHHVPTFVDASRFDPQFDPGGYVLYFGRIAREKGVETLIDAFARLKKNPRHKLLKLKLAGRSNRDELTRLQNKITGVDGIDVLGELGFDPMRKLVRDAVCVVVPSIWYDNMPNTVLESFASGKPVVASNIGSLPEVVEDQISGLLFEAGNAAHLADRLEYLLGQREIIREMGMNARHLAETEFSPEKHYQRLSTLFLSVAS